MISRHDLCRTLCKKAGITRPDAPTDQLTKDELLKISAYLDVKVQRVVELERRNRDLEGMLYQNSDG